MVGNLLQQDGEVISNKNVKRDSKDNQDYNKGEYIIHQLIKKTTKQFNVSGKTGFSKMDLNKYTNNDIKKKGSFSTADECSTLPCSSSNGESSNGGNSSYGGSSSYGASRSYGASTRYGTRAAQPHGRCLLAPYLLLAP